MKIKTSKQLKGFTVPEVIMVTACIALIASLSFGDMTRIFTQQMQEQEKTRQIEIRKAMEVYAKKEGKLPSDADACVTGLDSSDSEWSAQLSKYSNLSSDQICFDTWGNVRHYIMETEVRTFNAGAYEYDIYFASVLSEGTNTFKDSTDWSGLESSGINTGFEDFDGEEDDIVVKFNDSKIKRDAYEETLDRIHQLEIALERYADVKRYTAISLDMGNYGEYIMYPRDGSTVDSGKYFHTSQLSIESDIEVDTLGTGTDGPAYDATTLTEVLGVPEYLGRNALTGNPLWYISNPGIDRTLPCTNRGTDLGTIPYPPIIMVTTGDIKPGDCV